MLVFQNRGCVAGRKETLHRKDALTSDGHEKAYIRYIWNLGDHLINRSGESNMNDKAPKCWVWGNDSFGGPMPCCPECEEPTYSMPCCPFCGQPLKEPVAEKVMVFDVFYGERDSERQGTFVVQGRTLEEARIAMKKELFRLGGVYYMGSNQREDLE